MTEVLDLLPLLRQCATITCWYNEKLPSDKKLNMSPSKNSVGL